MLRTDAKVGMKIVFGRPGERAEKSVGVIERVNPAKAKVKLLEERGTHKTYPVGTVFDVPYSLMEPAPEDGDKTAVKIGKPKTPIVVGTTTFRAGYADGCPLWKVIKSVGPNAYLCEIVNEQVNIGGKVYDSDFAGTRKAFMGMEIAAIIESDKFCGSLENEAEAFYASLQPDQIVHYRNGFGDYVRCRTVKESGETKLKPIALVGEWESHNLPRRSRNGEVYNGYHADQVINGKTFRPHASNIYEYPKYERKGADPAAMTPVNLTVPPMTPEEAKEAALWRKVERIHEATGSHDGDNLKILAAVKAILAE